MPGDWDVCVTSFEMCIIEGSTLKAVTWKCVVIDEAHRIKDEGSKLAEILRSFKTQHRMLLTGTPLQNNLHELWALLSYVQPRRFSNPEAFDSWNTSDEVGKVDTIQLLRASLKPIMLRRLKSGVEKELLPKKVMKVYVELTDMQQELQTKILRQQVTFTAPTGEVKQLQMQNTLMQLQKCANHPYLFDGAEPGPPFSTGQHLVDNSGKLTLLDSCCPGCKSRDRGC